MTFASPQPRVSYEAVEVAKTSEGSKDKESRKRRKQDTAKTVVETTSIEGSPDKANVRKKKHGHKDSNPNSAHSCVGDNVSMVHFEQTC